MPQHPGKTHGSHSGIQKMADIQKVEKTDMNRHGNSPDSLQIRSFGGSMQGVSLKTRGEPGPDVAPNIKGKALPSQGAGRTRTNNG